MISLNLFPRLFWITKQIWNYFNHVVISIDVSYFYFYLVWICQSIVCLYGQHIFCYTFSLTLTTSAWERERLRLKFSFHCFISKMATVVRAELSWSHKQGASFESLTCIHGPKDFGHFLLLRCIVESWVRSRAIKTQISAQMDCLHHTWWFDLLCHCTSTVSAQMY